MRWLIRERIMEELQERHHMDDGELLEMIDRSIGEMGQEIFLPLKERLWLRGSLFDSFRRLDILQELIDDSSVSEIMVNGAGKIFMERNGRMESWDRNTERPEQLAQQGDKYHAAHCGCKTEKRRAGQCSHCSGGPRWTGVDYSPFSKRSYYHGKADSFQSHKYRGSRLSGAAGGGWMQYVYQRRDKLWKNHIPECIVILHTLR